MPVVQEAFDIPVDIAAIRTGTVDFLVVDQLSKAIDDLRALKNYEKLTFQLTAEE